MSVAVETHGATRVIRFANPPHHLINNKGAAMLGTAVAEALADEAVRAIVLTGTGDVFIRHADVAQIARAGEALASGRIAPASFLDAPFPHLGRMIEGARKPVIAAINGMCMGGGLEIALCCTMRIAAPDVASIGLPEIRIGIFPGSGGTQRLARLIGWQRARLFALRGEVVDAATALALGLVDEVADAPLDRALAVAASFETRPAAAVAAVLDLTRGEDLAAGLDAELIAFATLLRDQPAVRDRLRTFVERGEALDRLP